MNYEREPQAWVGAWSERRAALTPDREALVDAATGRRFTYADLDRRADRTARLLDRFGVRDGERVAVVSRNRPAVVDLFLATAKTGGVLAPLSHRLAPPEQATLLSGIDPGVVIVEEPFEGDVRRALERIDRDPAVLALAADGDHADEAYSAALPDDDAPVETATLAPEDPHLLLHTGGSTGTPKETVLPHRTLVWNSLNTITAWGLRPDDVTPLTFPTFHTGGWNVITVPLWHMGGTVVLDREVDAGALLATVEREAATVLVAVPAVLRRMARHDRWADTDLSTLRVVKSGGGPCREAVMDRWWDRGVDLSQGYGLTECGPNNFAMPDDWPREKADTVGKPVPHVDVRVVRDGDAVEQGAVGELELRGPGAADGYRDAPEESAATFGTWVSTGDLARVDEDGYVSIEGRVKELFVSGGENVYPVEVERVLAEHPGVEDAVVVPVSDEEWGQVGRAVVVGEVTLADLQSFCEGRLAGYKHPRDLVLVDALPTSGPEKIDRAAVRAQYGE
ncbi:MAG: class I adenylate-forming enzyme family protein [Haloarculaceae archaeon]